MAIIQASGTARVGGSDVEEEEGFDRVLVTRSSRERNVLLQQLADAFTRYTADIQLRKLKQSSVNSYANKRSIQSTTRAHCNELH